MMAVSTCALLLNSYTCRRPAASGRCLSGLQPMQPISQQAKALLCIMIKLNANGEHVEGLVTPAHASPGFLPSGVYGAIVDLRGSFQPTAPDV